MATGTVVTRGYLAAHDVDGIRGFVRATFARCAYVTVNDGGPPLVLHASGRDHTPTSLCPATWPASAAAVAVGDPVVWRAGHLKVGTLVLDIRGAREWRPAPPSRCAASLPTPWMAGRDYQLRLSAANRRTGELVPALERALARRDADRVARCVASLVGRGPGLTPSGDDALVGMLGVLHRLAPSHDASLALLAPAVGACLHRTGDISAHYLRLAVDGHLGERLIALCDALATTAAPDVVVAAAAAVAATGETSGADALLGVAGGLRLLATTGADDLATAA